LLEHGLALLLGVLFVVDRIIERLRQDLVFYSDLGIGILDGNWLEMEVECLGAVRESEGADLKIAWKDAMLERVIDKVVCVRWVGINARALPDFVAFEVVLAFADQADPSVVEALLDGLDENLIDALLLSITASFLLFVVIIQVWFIWLRCLSLLILQVFCECGLGVEGLLLAFFSISVFIFILLLFLIFLSEVPIFLFFIRLFIIKLLFTFTCLSFFAFFLVRLLIFLSFGISFKFLFDLFSTRSLLLIVVSGGPKLSRNGQQNGELLCADYLRDFIDLILS